MKEMNVNLVELCSDLADIAIVEIENSTNEPSLITEDGEVRYTDKYQEIFDVLYDSYYEKMQEIGLKHENI